MVCKICGQSGHYQKTCKKIKRMLPIVDLSMETLKYESSVEIKKDRKPKKRDIYELDMIEIQRSNILNETAPRVFGTYGECIIDVVLPDRPQKSLNQHHDRFSEVYGKIEIKFSRAKCPREKITLGNFKNCITSPTFVRYSEIDHYKWDCNLQQIKPKEFDTLFYGLMFWDKIFIFKINSESIEKDKLIGYCPKQHKGNIGEGQFHIKPTNFNHHYKNYLYKEMTWEELYDMI